MTKEFWLFMAVLLVLAAAFPAEQKAESAKRHWIETKSIPEQLEELRHKDRSQMTAEELRIAKYLDGLAADAAWDAVYGGISPSDTLKAANAEKP